MTAQEQVDVLVVGGGPAGLAAAEAAAAGASVLLVHRDAEVGRPVRTSGGSWVRDLRRLGVPERLYRPIEVLRLAGPRELVETRFAEDRPAVLDVTATYRHLADRALRAGAALECGTSLIDARDTPEGVRCVLRGGGRVREVLARRVVEASGHRRAVLSALGLARPPRRLGVGIEYEMEDRGSDPAAAALFVGSRLAPTGYGWVFPTPAGTLRVGVGLHRPDSVAEPRALLDAFLASEDARTLGVRAGRVLEVHTGALPAEGPSGRLVHGRVAAVGDAAGQALPLVGEGIRFAVEAGRRAGEAVRRSLEEPKRASRHLADYEAWWRRTHLRRFARAQAVNVRISRYTDERWDEKLRLLSLLTGDEMARLLRMELGSRDLVRLLARRPVPVALHLLRRWRGGARRPEGASDPEEVFG